MCDKRSAYEEPLLIPMIVRYPRLFPKGKALDEMVLNIDLRPQPGLLAPMNRTLARMFILGTFRRQAVAADGSRRILSALKMAPTAVGGYWGMKCSG
jgi:hypothetical protein